jgi:cyanophycin synthetase
LKKNIGLLGFPLLIKPSAGLHGAGITRGISNEEEALVAYKAASAAAGSGKVIMEQLLNGYDYRLLVVNHRLVAAVRCLPASITGDGVSTIEQLLEKMKNNILQASGNSRSVPGLINSDILERNHLLLHSVLPSGELLILERVFSRQNGGTTEDITDKVHASTARMAERVAALAGLDICAIEIRTRDISREIKPGAGAVVNVEAKPQLELFMEPAEGLSRNIAKPIVDMLFPHGNDGRIPIVAVTGTNGKTTTTRLIAHIAQHAGHTVGFTSTEGIYIGGLQVLEGDCTGPASSQVVLFDPTIDLAVLECARGGILRSGLAFKQCDISIVTNVSADHLGLSDIDTAEEMARVKMVVPRTTKTNGYAILNADDDLVYAMRDELTCNIALFSMTSGNERLIQHCASGGIAALVEDGYLTVREGKWKTRIGKIESIPLTFNSRAECMVKNILPATLAAILQGFSLHTIREALHTFIPGPVNTPGRMNIFSFKDFQVMVDYAHNPGGMLGLKKFLAGTDAAVHVGIIGAAGDRRDEDIREIGSISAEIFDEIIIRHDKDLRGRTKEEMTVLLSDGITRVNPHIPLTVVSNETEAIQVAMEHAVKNAFITVCSEKIHETISFISEQLAKETEQVLQL